ncbi:MAG: hypothetical protein ACO1RT_10215 [Planctomycetaceae bacterium]
MRDFEAGRRRKRLPGSQFGAMRRCADKCLTEAGGDQDKAITLVEQRMGMVVGSAWVAIAIELAIKLIIWWIENRITERGSVPTPGEPGQDDGDYDEDTDEYLGE